MTRNRRVLIVEDDHNVGSYYQDVLGSNAIHEDEPLEVTRVEDGATAIKAVEEALEAGRPFCGGFFDLMLPGTPSGVDAIQIVHNLDPDMFVCVVSGADIEIVQHLDPVFRERAEDWDYLQKPAAAEEIYRRGMKMAARWNNRRIDNQVAEKRDVLAGLGMVASGLAHEMNNPIGFVGTNLEVLQKYAGRLTEMAEVWGRLDEKLGDDPRTAEVREAYRRLKIDNLMRDMPVLIEQSAEGMRLAGEISLALKSASPTPAATNGPGEINVCVERAVTLARHELKRKAEVVRDLGKVPPVTSSPSELTQILLNLLINAAQSLDGSGKITIRTRVDGDSALIEVRDTGRGIPEEQLEKIFDAFFTTKPTGKGSGLGLVVVRDLAQKRGGKVGVSSDVGEGSCFTIELPLAKVGAAC